MSETQGGHGWARIMGLGEGCSRGRATIPASGTPELLSQGGIPQSIFQMGAMLREECISDVETVLLWMSPNSLILVEPE